MEWRDLLRSCSYHALVRFFSLHYFAMLCPIIIGVVVSFSSQLDAKMRLKFETRAGIHTFILLVHIRAIYTAQMLKLLVC